MLEGQYFSQCVCVITPRIIVPPNNSELFKGIHQYQQDNLHKSYGYCYSLSLMKDESEKFFENITL